MANGSVNFNMQFNADTAQAKKQIQDLQQSLTELTNIGTKGDGSTFLTKSMADAQVKANQLKVSLQEAFNVNTGKLDLTKFSESLKKSGITLEEYRKSLSTLGPEGQKAFVSLANAISTSEVPLKRTSKLMQDLGTTMKNTVKWQLSSSAMHGFMSAVSQAWNYAKDLNESLNNIRIVTGQNTDQMAAFAQQANAAAKALSTTTTKYTDASLIYYQQGLDDKEVQDRTNTTIKLANVSRQSVEESADQMTTIWNNYADGSKELEYYADVLVKLGAATASSSEEIATGISKFASVGETVGLTYEYATAALATVTATTRQSADTVGTAFKTLFARIQDLELGKTLDDGTDLGQYSQALEKVGINIKTTSGEVKDMNTILDEMGEKWTNLGKDEQIALAQNVAGVRQYTQLMALMNNWDFFKENVETASGASGALEEQQEIYAESWEAAGKRVKASLEDVYDSLINDEAVIKATDAIAKLVDGVGAFVDSIGGAKGVLLALGAVLVNVFSKQVGTSIDNTIAKIKTLTPSGQKQAQQLKYDAVNSLQQQAKEQGNNEQGKALKQSYENQAKIQQQIIDNSGKFTEAELERAQALQREVAEYGAINAEKAKAVDLAKSELDDQKTLLEATRELKTERLEATKNSASQQLDDVNKEIDLYGTEAYEEYIQMKKELDEARSNGTMDENTYAKEVQALEQMSESMDSQVVKVKELKQRQAELNNTIEETNAKLKAMGSNKSIETYTEQLKNAAIAEQQVVDITKKMGAVSFNEDETLSQEGTHQLEDYVASLTKLQNLPADVAEKIQKLNQELQSANPDTHKIYEYVAELSKIDNETNSAIAATNAAEQALREFGIASGLSEEQVTNLVSSIYKCANAETELSVTQTAMAQKMQQTSNTINNFGKSISTIGSKISSFASTASSLAMVGMSFKSLKETLTDDSLSGMEKLLSSLMSIGMLGGSLGPLLNNMGGSISALGKKALAAAGESTVLSGGLFGEASAATTATGATATFGATLASVLLPIAAVAAAVVGLKLLFNFITELNSVDLSKAAESAQELAKTSKEDFEEASTKVENFTSDLEELATKYDTLEDLTRGTDEWNTALQDVNTTVLSLLSTYPELASAVSNVNGVLTVDMEQQNAILQQLQEEQAKKGAGYYANQIQSTQLNQQYQAQTLQDTIGAQSETGFFSNNKFSQDFQNAANRGTTSDLFNKIISEISAGRISENSSEQQIADTLGIEITKESESFISSIRSNIDALTEYANSLSTNAGLIDTYTQQMNESFLATSESFQESENQAALAASLSKDIQEAKDQWKNEQDGFTQTTAAQYLQSQGLDWTKNKASIDKDGKLTYTGADNKETTVELDAQILEYLATINATLSEEQIQNQEQENSKIANSGNAVAAGFGDQMLGVESGLTEAMDLTGYTQKEMDAIHAYINDSNNEISDSVKKAYDLANSERVKANTEAVQQMSKTMDGDLAKSVLESSTDSKQAIADNYTEVFKQAGFEGTKALNSALGDLDDKSIKAVGEALDDIDWSSGDGLDQLQTKLTEAGIDIDLTSDSWIEFSSLMQETTFPSLDTLLSQLSEVSNITKDLALGDIVNEKDYNKIIAYNSALSDFFVKTKDGYKMIGDQGTLNDAIFKSFTDQSTKALQVYDSYQKLKDSGLADTIAAMDTDHLTSLLGNRDSAGEIASSGIQAAMSENNISSDQLDQAVAEIQKEMAQGVSAEDITNLDAYKNIIEPLAESLSNAASADADFNTQISETVSTAMSSADSLSQLNSIMDSFSSLGSDNVDAAVQQSYANALMSIAAGYENCEQELQAYQATGSDAAKQALELAVAAAEQAESFDLDAEEIEELSDNYAELAESGEEAYQSLKKADGEIDSEAVTDAAVRYKRLNKAVEDIRENYDDYAEVLKNVQKATDKNSKTSAAFSDTAKKMKKSLADMINTSEKFIDIDFLDSIDPKDFQAAAKGDEAAIGRIRDAFVDAQADMLGMSDQADALKSELNGLADGAVIDLDNTPALQAMIEAMAKAHWSADDIEAALSGLSIDCDVTPLMGSLDEAKAAAAETGDAIVEYGSVDAEANSVTVQNDDIQQDVGFDETISSKPVIKTSLVLEEDATETTPVQTVIQEFHKSVTPQLQEETASKEKTVTGVKLSNMHKSAGGKVNTSNKSAGGGGGKGGGGGGGGGGGSSKPAKKIQKTKFTDLGDRYHTITRQINDQARATDKLAKLEDRLYGSSKIKAMKEQSKEILKQIELNKKKQQQAEEYLKTDQSDLESAISDMNSSYSLNLKVEYDSKGNIENYREIIEALTAQKNQWEDYLNSLSTQEEQDSDENQEAQEELENKISAITDAISQYEETLDTLNDVEDSNEDLLDQWQSLNFDAWTTQFDLIVENTQRIRDNLEHTNKLRGISEDNVFTAQKALNQKGDNMRLDWDELGKMLGDKALQKVQEGNTNPYEVFQDAWNDKDSQLGSLRTQYKNGEINQEQYMEGLKKFQDELWALGDDFVDTWDAVMESYSKAAEDAQSRMDKFTESIDHASSRLDHYSNLLDIVGQSNNLDKKGTILEAQKSVKENKMNAYQSEYDLWTQQVKNLQPKEDSLKAELEAARASKDQDRIDKAQSALDEYNKTYDAAVEKQKDAEENWLSAQEEWAQAAKDLAENELAKASKAARKALLGDGVSWDAVITQMDRFSSIGEEYLTNTNKIYGITKLTRSIQDDIDKSSNKAAKARLETFKKSTEELGKQKQLSQYELDIQNQKFELLQAEIALQEAQEAKSQVRLSRDDEGNYSYTYVADESQMQEAEDNYLEKQNNLYNTLLEGANGYYEKYVQTMKEATETFDAINEAYLNGEIENETEYQRQMLEAQQYYNKQLQTYKNLYNISMSELGEQAVDSWTDNNALILTDTKNLNGNLETSYNTFKEQYISYIEEENQALDRMVNYSQLKLQKELPGYWKDSQTAVQNFSNEVTTKIPIATEDEKKFNEAIKATTDEAQAAEDGVKDLTTELEKNLTAVGDIVQKWIDYKDAVDKVRESLAQLEDDTTQVIVNEGELPVEETPAPEPEPEPTPEPEPEPTPEPEPEPTGITGQYVVWQGNTNGRVFTLEDGRTFTLNGTYKNGYAGSPDPEAVQIQQAFDHYFSSHGSYDGAVVRWIGKNGGVLDLKALGFDTGGYTGEWGEDGRLALLHQKELVLNAEDTENMLQMVGIVRDLVNTLDANSIASIASSLSALYGGSIVPASEANDLNQNIQIEANFPNATDKESIKEAFADLTNLASQYANRKTDTISTIHDSIHNYW